MVKLGFYCMNQKGYEVLIDFIRVMGSSYINYVVSSRDKNILKDYYDDIKELCIYNDVVFLDRNDNAINRYTEDYKVSIGWRWIIPNYQNLLVMHDSLLPKYRGFAPLVNMLINGENIIGVSLLYASSEYDKGNIIGQSSININYPIKIQQAIDLIAPLYSEVLLDSLKKLCSNSSFEGELQNCDQASYSPWLDAVDYYIDWKWSASKIRRFVDAVGPPYDGAKIISGEKIFRVFDVEEYGDITVEHRERHVGKIIFMHKQKPVVICGEGLLLLDNIESLDPSYAVEKMPFRTRFKRNVL